MPAPASWPLFRAAAKAAESTTGPRGVNQVSAALHLGNPPMVNHAPRAVIQQAMQNNNVRLGEHFIKSGKGGIGGRHAFGLNLNHYA
jgi:hypothetical protein